MPSRSFNDSYWGRKHIQELPFEAKYLYTYLFTNEHTGAAGVYQITTKTISFETGLPEDRLPKLLQLLAPIVEWLEAEDIIWVKNFIKHQGHNNAKFLIAAGRAVRKVTNNGLVKQLLEYNKALGIIIPMDDSRITEIDDKRVSRESISLSASSKPLPKIKDNVPLAEKLKQFDHNAKAMDYLKNTIWLGAGLVMDNEVFSLLSDALNPDSPNNVNLDVLSVAIEKFLKYGSGKVKPYRYFQAIIEEKKAKGKKE